MKCKLFFWPLIQCQRDTAKRFGYPAVSKLCLQFFLKSVYLSTIFLCQGEPHLEPHLTHPFALTAPGMAIISVREWKSEVALQAITTRWHSDFTTPRPLRLHSVLWLHQQWQLAVWSLCRASVRDKSPISLEYGPTLSTVHLHPTTTLTEYSIPNLNYSPHPHLPTPSCALQLSQPGVFMETSL